MHLLPTDGEVPAANQKAGDDYTTTGTIAAEPTNASGAFTAGRLNTTVSEATVGLCASAMPTPHALPTTLGPPVTQDGVGTSGRCF